MSIINNQSHHWFRRILPAFVIIIIHSVHTNKKNQQVQFKTSAEENFRLTIILSSSLYSIF